jgi:hypothetical protein
MRTIAFITDFKAVASFSLYINPGMGKKGRDDFDVIPSPKTAQREEQITIEGYRLNLPPEDPLKPPNECPPSQ